MKISGSHTSAIEMVEKLLNYLKRYPSVKKVSLGPIQSSRGAKSGQKKIKLFNDTSCLRLVITSNNTVQTIRLYFDNPQHSDPKLIKNFCERNRIDYLSP